jgi:mono/diheme cytochrome c family protein
MKKTILGLVLFTVIGAIAFHVFIAYDNDFPYGRMRETPAVRPHEQPLPVMEAGVVPYKGGEMTYRASDPDRLTPPFPVNRPEVIAGGKTGYFTYCAQCHGKYYDGNGTVGQSFSPLPTDLRSQGVQKKSAGALFYEISYGIPKGRQPALASTITVNDRWRIAAYIQSLGVRRSAQK